MKTEKSIALNIFKELKRDDNILNRMKGIFEIRSCSHRQRAPAVQTFYQKDDRSKGARRKSRRYFNANIHQSKGVMVRYTYLNVLSLFQRLFGVFEVFDPQRWAVGCSDMVSVVRRD